MLDTDEFVVGVGLRTDEPVKFGVDGAIAAVCVFWIRKNSGK